MTAAYPLTWPNTMPRCASRDKGLFKTSLAQALKNVDVSLNLFAKDSGKPLENIVMSSNVTLGMNRPDDPGVAVWFTWDGMQVCIPVDRYLSVEANLQAIHHIVEARRVELRHGTLALVRATFTGFLALPAPGAKRHWRDVLGFCHGEPLTRQELAAAYRGLSAKRHPDTPGGSQSAMAELNVAHDEAKREIK